LLLLPVATVMGVALPVALKKVELLTEFFIIFNYLERHVAEV